MKFRIVFVLVSLCILLAGTAFADDALARKLLTSQGCKGCHIFEGNGGTLGPAIDKVGTRMNAEQIEQKLLDPKATSPKSYMPNFKHLKDEEIKALVDFLKNRK